jgi:aspartate/methionine/tyrosine aminotransferase
VRYRRMPIEIESPEQFGYDRIACNLTESSVTDSVLGDLDLDLSRLLLCYGDHVGLPPLRAAIVADEPGVSPEQVLVTTGAAAALYLVATALLEPGDRVLVARTNYATNLETPRAIGAVVDVHELRFENGFQVDVNLLESQMRPDTRLVSLTCPHNPTGTMMSEADLRRVIGLCEQRNIHLLFDETYREMSFTRKLPMAAALSPWAISVSSLSKTWGLPGIRIGWAITQDPRLFETLLAAKEQIVICNSVVDEAIAERFLSRKHERLPAIRAHIEAGFAIVRDWMASQRALEWVEPEGGVVCFPRFRADHPVDIDEFYRILQDEYRTHVGPGHWFEVERTSMRIGYGWPDAGQLSAGLANISKAAARARR